MLKRIFLSGVLAGTLLFGGQLMYTPTAAAEVQAGNAVVYERSIKVLPEYIQVAVRSPANAPHPMFLAFKQRSDGTWLYGDAAGIGAGQGKWSLVSSSQMANDVLYVVLQYV